MAESASPQKFRQVAAELRECAAKIVGDCDDINSAAQTCISATSDKNVKAGSQDVKAHMNDIRSKAAGLNSIAQALEEEAAAMEKAQY